MKNAYKYLVYSLILVIISACTKEIKVVKGPATNENPYNGIALFSVGNSSIMNALSISGSSSSKLYSLDLTGKETEIKKEDGTLFQNVDISGIKPVKSGLIFSLREQVYDSVQDTTTFKETIYFTADGATAKVIAENNSLFFYEFGYNNPSATNGFHYLCSNQGVLEWNDSEKKLSNVHPFMPNSDSGCYGIEKGNDFVAVMRETIPSENSEDGYTTLPVKLIKFSHKNSGAEEIVLRDHASISDYDGGEISNFTKLGDEVIFVERYFQMSQPPFIGIVKVDLKTLTKTVLFQSPDPYSPGTYWTDLYLLFRGDAVGNKIYFVSGKGYEGETVNLLEETTQDMLESNSFHQQSKLYSYSKDSGAIQLSDIDLSYGHIQYMRSEEKVFILKFQQKAFYFPETTSYYTDNKLTLLDSSGQNIVYDFGIRPNINTNEVQGTGVIMITDFEDRNTRSNPKLTVYSLPKMGQGVLSDSRFDLKKYQFVSFLNFYDKTMFQYSLYPEAGQPSSEDNSRIGFFGSDGEIHFIDKDNAGFNLMMKL